MYAGLSHDDAVVIIDLARELTGMDADLVRHSVLVHNVAARMTQLQCRSLAEYLQVAETQSDEYAHLISCLTIHTTSWFREPSSFEIFQNILNQLNHIEMNQSTFRLLSIGCSTGEELYSLGSLLDRHRTANNGFEYSLEGWDIDPVSLRIAREGKYQTRSLNFVPAQHRTHLLQTISDANESETFLVSQSLRDRSRFRVINVLEMPLPTEPFDFIFCRNLLIYFNTAQVKHIIASIIERLKPGGHLCTGVSEVSAASGTLLKPAGPAVFRFDESKRQLVNPARTSKKVEEKGSQRPFSKEILVVDDEEDFLELICQNLSDAGYSFASAKSAEEALMLLKTFNFGLIVSDWRMAGRSGSELCREARTMGYDGAFILVSGYADKDMARGALAAGVNEVLAKPFTSKELLKLIEVYLPKFQEKPHLKSQSILGRKQSKIQAIALGASTGGTELLIRLLSDLPRDCPPVLVVQHITQDFAEPFARRLAKASGLKLATMRDGEILSNGSLYIALGDYHVGVRKVGGNICLSLNHEAKIAGHRPSVDFLFSSLAKAQVQTFAALLTGMGRDGASGLYKLRVQGSLTIAQNEDSCAVFGMPKEAIALRAALFVLDPYSIREKLMACLDNKRSGEIALIAG